MTYKLEVWEKLDADRPLRQKLAMELGVGEAAITAAVNRKSPRLTQYAAVKLLSKELQIPEDEMFDQCPAQA